MMHGQTNIKTEVIKFSNPVSIGYLDVKLIGTYIQFILRMVQVNINFLHKYWV